MGNSTVKFRLKIPVHCWEINKTLQGVTFICRTLYCLISWYISYTY